MDNNAIIGLINIGIAGIGLYLFVTGAIQSRKTIEDDRETRAKIASERDARDLEVHRQYEARIAQGDAALVEMRKERNQWRDLTLGTERRLDRVAPTLATVAGTPVPSAPPAPSEASD